MFDEVGARRVVRSAGLQTAPAGAAPNRRGLIQANVIRHAASGFDEQGTRHLHVYIVRRSRILARARTLFSIIRMLIIGLPHTCSISILYTPKQNVRDPSLARCCRYESLRNDPQSDYTVE